MKLLLALSAVVAVMALCATSTAQASPKRHAPAWFVRQATCIHNHEEHWSWRWHEKWHPHYSYWNGYYTGMQFAKSTWQTANKLLHSHADPHTGNKRIIILHAYAIVRYDGDWHEWSTAYMCGLPH